MISRYYVCDSFRWVWGRELAASEMSIVVGAHRVFDHDEKTQVRHQVQSAVVHESYNSPKTLSYDIMLLRLRTSIQFNDQTSPICVDGTRFPPDTRCWVTGWGTSTNPNGKYSKIMILFTTPTQSYIASFLTSMSEKIL